MPLPNTRLIHPRFEAHHRPIAEGQMEATCRITDTTGQPVYDGPCRVQQAGDGSLVPVAGDQRITAATYAVVIPADSQGVAANHLVEVTACDGDPELVGRQLTVRSVTRGSIRWQQTLVCDMHGQPAQ